MIRTTMAVLAACALTACGGTDAPDEIPAETLAPASLTETDTPPIETEIEPEPLSAEQQAATNAEINLAALDAYRAHAEAFRTETGSYPETKRNFRSAIGAFEDAAEAQSEDDTRVDLDLPEGAEMTQPGAIVYRSDGTDFKLIAQRTGDCSVVRKLRPELIDPKRDYGPGDCVAYGYWTPGAETW